MKTPQRPHFYIYIYIAPAVYTSLSLFLAFFVFWANYNLCKKVRYYLLFILIKLILCKNHQVMMKKHNVETTQLKDIKIDENIKYDDVTILKIIIIYIYTYEKTFSI
jgi:hypothetical protein